MTFLRENKELKKKKLFYAGRLDYMSRGLMILSTDGDFIQQMSHPSHFKEKQYLVKTQKPIDYQTLETFSHGFFDKKCPICTLSI